MKILLTLLLLVPLHVAAETGPFGLEQGMKLEEIQKFSKLRMVQPHVYSTADVPLGHPAFEDYRLVITPQHGLCKVVAWTDDISSSAYGDSVKAKFESLFEALSSKYGNSKRFDFLRSGSIWDDAKDWMMSLAKGERHLVAYWDREEGSNLPDSINAIKLGTHGLDSRSAMIELGYEFRINSECSSWIKSKENSSL